MKIFISGMLTGALVGAVLAAPTPALAQQAVIERCRAMPTDAERIACLEGALAVMGERGGEAQDRGGFRIPFFGGDDEEPAPVAAPQSAAQELGAEQVAVREGTFDDAEARDAAPRVTASISRAETDPYGNLVVQLDNGQVWRQLEREAIPVNVDMDEAQPVEITGSGFGGYRMRLLTPGRRIVVERVR